jgi:hypothetical protein
VKKEILIPKLRKQFTANQIEILLTIYEHGHVSRKEIEKTFGFACRASFQCLNNSVTIPRPFQSAITAKVALSSLRDYGNNPKTTFPTTAVIGLPPVPSINTPVPPLNGIKHSYETEYFLEMGVCGIRTSNIVGNPKDSPNCFITSLEEISTDMSKHKKWTDSAIINPGIIQFCLIYHLDDGAWRLLMTDIDYK